MRKILFIKLIEQGATVLAYSAIHRAIEQVGRENVYFLVFEENREILFILDLLPAENVLIVRNRDFLTFSRTSFPPVPGPEASDRCGVDLEFFCPRLGHHSFLTGAESRVGCIVHQRAPYRGDLMTHRVSTTRTFTQPRLTCSWCEALARSPGEIPLSKIPVRDLAVTAPFPADRGGNRPAGEAPGGHLGGAGSGPLVLLNPNEATFFPCGMWSTENFIDWTEDSRREAGVCG